MASLEVIPYSYDNYAFDFTLPSQDLPETVTFPPYSPIDHLDHIELLNFKSFSGSHYIGPFLSNTTIVGPNGSGKSNIIDAICFVFGISVSSLRSTSLNDLVSKTLSISNNLSNKSANKNLKNNTKKQEILCHVTLFLVMSNGDSLELKRTIDSSYKSQVFINGEDFHWRHYAKYLLMCNIQMNPASFLILQSETYHIIEKTPKELLEYFEKICGSHELKEKYSELKTSLETLQNTIKNNTLALNSMKNERKKLRQQVQYSEEYKKLVEELETLENQHYGLAFFRFDLAISRKSREFYGKTQEIAEFKRSQEKERLERQKKAVYFKKKREEFRKMEEKFLRNKKDLSENRLELSKITEEISYSSKIVSAKELSLRKMEEELAFSGNCLDRLRKQEAELLEELQKCEKELEIDENNQDISAKYKKNFQEYLQFQKEVGVKLQPLKLELQKIKGHERKLVEKSEEIKRKIESFEETFAQTSLKSKENALLIEKTHANIAEVGENIKELASKYDKLKKSVHNSEEKKLKLLQLREKKEALLSEAQYILNSMLDLKEKSELFSELRQIKGFKEDVSTLISPLRPEFDLPLRIAFGAALEYLVVDTSETAKLINNILREKGLQRDVLILENIPKIKRKLNADLIGNHGLLAENTLSFRREIPKLDAAISYLLQGKVICETAKHAEQIKSNYTKKKQQLPKEIVTYEGLVIRQGVVTTYGNIEKIRENARKLTKFMDQKSLELRKNKEQEIDKIRLELKKAEEDLKDFNTSQEEADLRRLEVKIQENKAKLTVLENESKALSESKRALDSQVKAQHAKIKAEIIERTKIDKELKQIREDLQENEKNFAGQQNEIYKPLLQKLKIADLKEIKGKDYEQLDRLYERKLSITKTLEALRGEIKANKAATLEKNLKNLKESLENDEKNHEFLNETLRKLEKKSADLNKDLETAKEELAKGQAALNLEESEENRNFARLQALDADFSQKEKEIKQIEIEIQQLYDKKSQLHEELKIKSVNLPLLQQPSAYEAKFEEGNTAISTRNARKFRVHIDYEGLNMKKLLKSLVNFMENEDESRENAEEEGIEWLNALEIGSIEKKLEEMDEEIAKKSEKIEDFTSNILQSSYSSVFNEKLGKFATKIQEMVKEQDVLLEKERQVAEEFESSKRVRMEKFMVFFEEVKRTTDQIYKTLTKTDKNYDVGGSALLYLENQSDPFNGGIIYSPTPPNKRFVFDSEQLSGGEKTMGGLALLFALNLANRNKFMIFDETDAYLDFENSQKFMEFTKEISDKAQMQIVVISHKKNIYENADSLIGVSYASRFSSSQAFSLDLRE